MMAGDEGAGTDRSAKAASRTADLHAAEESDGRIVPAKGANKGGGAAPAERLEGRRPTAENTERARPVPDAGPDLGGSRGLHGVGCTVCARQHSGTSGGGSPPCCTMSTSIDCGRVFSR